VHHFLHNLLKGAFILNWEVVGTLGQGRQILRGKEYQHETTVTFCEQHNSIGKLPTFTFVALASPLAIAKILAPVA
jgi:hypothetical protein